MKKRKMSNFLILGMIIVALVVSPIHVHAVTNEQVEAMLRAWENGDTSVFLSQEEYENFKWAYENGYVNTTENAEEYKKKQAEIEASGNEIIVDFPEVGATTSSGACETESDEDNPSNAENKAIPNESSKDLEVTRLQGIDNADNQISQNVQESEEAQSAERHTVDYQSGFNSAVVIVIVVVVVMVLTAVVAFALILTNKPATENSKVSEKTE